MIVLIEIKETQYKWKLWFFDSHTIIFSWKLKIMPYLIFSLSTMIPNNNAPFSTTHRSAYVWKVFTTSNPSSFLFGKTEGKLSIIAKFPNVNSQMTAYSPCSLHLMRWWRLRDLKIYECFVHTYINVDTGLHSKLKIKGIHIKFGIFQFFFQLFFN